MEFEQNVHSTNYYTELYATLLSNRKWTTIATESATLEALYIFLSDFWAALPDNMSIRTNTFFELCDLMDDIGQLLEDQQ